MSNGQAHPCSLIDIEVNIAISVVKFGIPQPEQQFGTVLMAQRDVATDRVRVEKHGDELSQESNTNDTVSFVSSVTSEQDLPDFNGFLLAEEADGGSEAAIGQPRLFDAQKDGSDLHRKGMAIAGANSTSKSGPDSLAVNDGSADNSSMTRASNPASPCENFDSMVEKLLANKGEARDIDDSFQSIEAGTQFEERVDGGSAIGGSNRAQNAETAHVKRITSARDQWTSVHNRKCLNHPRWTNRP